MADRFEFRWRRPADGSGHLLGEYHALAPGRRSGASAQAWSRDASYRFRMPAHGDQSQTTLRVGTTLCIQQMIEKLLAGF